MPTKTELESTVNSLEASIRHFETERATFLQEAQKGRELLVEKETERNKLAQENRVLIEELARLRRIKTAHDKEKEAVAFDGQLLAVKTNALANASDALKALLNVVAVVADLERDDFQPSTLNQDA